MAGSSHGLLLHAEDAGPFPHGCSPAQQLPPAYMSWAQGQTEAVECGPTPTEEEEQSNVTQVVSDDSLGVDKAM